MSRLILGQTLSFTASPFTADNPADCAKHIEKGAVLIIDGKIADIGEAETLKAAHPSAEITDMGNHILTAGFVDCHAHFPQTAIIASWGKRLIDWLNGYTFPEELKFGELDYAREIAARFFDLSLSNGITTTSAYCSVHPQSVEAYFAEAQKRGLRAAGGKVMMDRHAPDGLTDTPVQGYEESKSLIEKWHAVDRLTYVITPRFAPTSTAEQLEAAGRLWAEHPDCLMQTHLSEQHDEIEWVHELYPDDPDYFGVYERFGLAGPGANMGHSIHLTDRERTAIKATGTGVSHCPTSNTFIGSGLCDVAGLSRDGVPVGLATDVGGGSSFSMLHTMCAAYEVAQLRHESLHAAQLYWLATVGSAKVMRMEDKIGNLVKGMEADIIALDPKATPVLAQRTQNSPDIWDTIFALQILGDDRAISKVWVAGKPVG